MNQEFAEVYKTILEGRHAVISREVEGQTYTRLFVPQDRLIILGGGHVAQPICHIASLLDFDVIVVDDRPAFANHERFPDAKEVICEPFIDALKSIGIRSTDYVCVVTRGHRYDADCLRVIFSGNIPSYLGIIGSKRRVSGLFDMLEAEGFERSKMDRIYTPIGVPIGAITPAEIGVSVTAQLVQHRRKNPIASDYEGLLEQTNSDLSALKFLAESDDRKALLLVLSSTGSTPVRSGSLMAMDYLGNGYGTIGGGCSEAGVMAKARKIIREGGSCVVDIDMTNEVAESEGMVCGGTMRVLVEAMQ